MHARGPQVALAALAALAACDAPARVKPWRHEPAAAAGRRPAQSDGGASSPAQRVRAHTLRIQMAAEPGRLTAIASPSLWARRITFGTIFEPLLRYVPPEGGGPPRYEPDLAQSWRVAPDGLEIRIELEPDVTFHDGRPLTASDVQFTLDAVRDVRHRLTTLRHMLDAVAAVELVTPHSLRIRLSHPSGWVLRALAEIPILPEHVYDGSLRAGGALVGTGPWHLASNRDGVVHLTRYAGYWGKPAAIADLEFVYQPDAAAALIAAKHGALDVIPAMIPAHWPVQARAPSIAAAFRPLELAPPRWRYLAFNAAHPPLDDVRVRHAIALLVDRKAIAKHVFGGLARPALWPIWPGGPVDGPAPPVPDFDPAAAGALLDAAGWRDTDHDGVRDKNGRPLRLVMIGLAEPARPPNAPPATARDYLVAAARKAGVIIDVKTSGASYLAKRVRDGSYDLVEIAWGGMVDGDVTSLVARPSHTRPAQPDVDRALAALGAAWDPAAREHLAPQLAAALAETWPIAGIVADEPHGLIARRVHGARVWDGWIDLARLTFGK